MMTNKKTKQQGSAFKDFISAMKKLRELGVLINKKDFTCQIGEWLVEMVYNGERAKNGIQKGWDIDINGKHVQVKTHAKAEKNQTSFSIVKKISSERIDELIIIVFTYDYKLKAFYKIPWNEALPYIELKGKQKTRYEIRWSKIRSYKLEPEKLPHQEIITFFL